MTMNREEIFRELKDTWGLDYNKASALADHIFRGWMIPDNSELHADCLDGNDIDEARMDERAEAENYLLRFINDLDLALNADPEYIEGDVRAVIGRYQ